MVLGLVHMFSDRSCTLPDCVVQMASLRGRTEGEFDGESRMNTMTFSATQLLALKRVVGSYVPSISNHLLMVVSQGSAQLKILLTF